MKFRLFAVMALLLSSLFTYADDCHKMIPVERKISRDYTKNPHRAPELIPLECYYNGFAGQV